MSCYYILMYMPRCLENAFEAIMLPIGIFYYREIIKSDYGQSQKGFEKYVDLNCIKVTVIFVISFIRLRNNIEIYICNLSPEMTVKCKKERH
jgi:hypothetical protein